MTAPQRDIVRDERSKFEFHDDVVYLKQTKRGLTRDTVEEISAFKEEPAWMHEYRLRAYDHFLKRPMPAWGGDLSKIDFDKIVYYRKPSEREEKSWDDVPDQIKKTFEKLGIPEAERKFLAGVGAQYDSEVVYHSVREELTKLGVVFMGTDQGLKEHPEIFQKYFGTVVPAEDNKFSALNAAVWSGGSFVYVPKGVEVPLPLQAYFRINGENTGQFERTLIVVDEGASVHYIEGCCPTGELVSLGDSMVPIESVVAGQHVMNSGGVEAEVSATRRRSYTGPMLKVVPVSVGNAFELTPEHPVWTIRRERVATHARRTRPVSRWDVDADRIPTTEPEWIPSGQLDVGDLICFPVATREQDHPELSDDLLRLLGYYLAEGSAFVNGASGVPTVTLSFHIAEKDKIEDARRLMSALSGKSAGLFENPKKNEARVYVYSRELMELCLKYCGHGSGEKRLHADLMELPPERQWRFIESYLLGDGSRHRRSNGHTLVRASTVSRTLAYQLQEVLARNGIYAGIQVRKAFEERMPDGREIAHREQYSLHFEEGGTVRQVWHDPDRNCYWVPIRKIESRPYDGWVYNERAERVSRPRVRGPQLHRAALRHRRAARRGRRGHRPARRQGPLHDHPELVERRLQPRHQARPRPRKRHRRMDRREHGLPDWRHARCNDGRPAADRARWRGRRGLRPRAQARSPAQSGHCRQGQRATAGIRGGARWRTARSSHTEPSIPGASIWCRRSHLAARRLARGRRPARDRRRWQRQ
jgi:Fe-S cluster assembly protein SufB